MLSSLCRNVQRTEKTSSGTRREGKDGVWFCHWLWPTSLTLQASVSLSLKWEDKGKGRVGIWPRVSPSTTNILCALGTSRAGGGLTKECCGRPELGPCCPQLQLPAHRLGQMGGEGDLRSEAGLCVQLGHHRLCDLGPTSS